MTRSVVLIVLCVLASVVSAEDTLPLKSKPPVSSTQSSKSTSNVLGSQPYVSSLGVFGSARINETALRQVLGKELDQWIQKGLSGDESAFQMELDLADKAKKQFDLAAADWTVMQFFEPADLAIHITLDVVEKSDVARRMPFKRRPRVASKIQKGFWLLGESTKRLLWI